MMDKINDYNNISETDDRRDKHVWDNAAEDKEKGGGYLIKCLQNSNVKNYMWYWKVINY